MYKVNVAPLIVHSHLILDPKVSLDLLNVDRGAVVNSLVHQEPSDCALSGLLGHVVELGLNHDAPDASHDRAYGTSHNTTRRSHDEASSGREGDRSNAGEFAKGGREVPDLFDGTLVLFDQGGEGIAPLRLGLGGWVGGGKGAVLDGD